MQLIVGGLLTNYSRVGKGKSILLIHGWGDSSKGLLGIANELKDFDVIALDLPGFGGSAKPTSDWGLSDYSDFIASFLAKLKVTSLEAIIGHSNGGAIAIKLVLSKKVDVKKLVLLSSAGIRNPKGLKNRALKIKTKVGKVLTFPLPKTTKENLRSSHYSKIGSDMLLYPELTGTFKKIVGENILDQAKDIDTPTLLIYGENDTKTPVSYGRMFHESISGSTLEIVSGADHFVHLDKPEIVLKLIKEFIC